VPTKGEVATKRFTLGAVFVYQLALWQRSGSALAALWQRFERGLPLNVGLKHYLKAARQRLNHHEGTTDSNSLQE
jgi:hypothetical protein